MRSLFTDDTRYLHIGFTREVDREPDRRTRRGHGQKPPAPNSRSEHGEVVGMAATTAIQNVNTQRQAVGVFPDYLTVLELSSINFDLREFIEGRFKGWIVDEGVNKIDGNTQHRYLVQFPTAAAFALFQSELEVYREARQDQSPLLTEKQRNDFFDAIQTVRPPSGGDRIGRRLATEGLPSAEALPFFMDVDLWHPGDTQAARRLLDEVRELCNRLSGSWHESTRTSSLLLAKVRGGRQLLDALLGLDFVARVDLPPLLSQAYEDILFDNVAVPASLPTPSSGTPLVCIVDSGVVSGHPFLAGWVIDEVDFDSGEDTPVDKNGHGTSVAGILVYGDVHECIIRRVWEPKVAICSAKVLRHEPSLLDPTVGQAVFPDRNRVEETVERAIRHFHSERQCRVFNLSLGDSLEVYSDGRQFPWAEKLDELARELDVVIIISAGNVHHPATPEGVLTREQFQEAIRDQLLSAEHRICNPATSALSLTVGAIARSDALTSAIANRSYPRDAFVGAPANAPAPFTRTGPGYTIDGTRSGIKPDLVAYGGNYIARADGMDGIAWASQHASVGEPTTLLERDGRFIGACCGTTQAAPHVAHGAAIALSSLANSLGQSPSSNLIRALVGSGAVLPTCGPEWLGPEATTLDLVGYGRCDTVDLPYSTSQRVRLIAMDEIEEDKLHVYKIGIPAEFIRERGRRGIVISLAYDPPVRASRKEYLARTMWFEAVHGLTTEEVVQFRGKVVKNDDGKLPSFPSGRLLSLRPTTQKSQWSTLQVRKAEWARANAPALKIVDGEVEPVLHVLVGCQSRFPTGLDAKQKYGLVVLFWHDGDEVNLHQSFSTRVTLRSSRVRIEG